MVAITLQNENFNWKWRKEGRKNLESLRKQNNDKHTKQQKKN